MRYLHSTALSKEELACALAERDRVRSGLIGRFDIVEPRLAQLCAAGNDRYLAVLAAVEQPIKLAAGNLVPNARSSDVKDEPRPWLA